MTTDLLKRALECLKFADDLIDEEPYEHSDSEMVDMHNELRQVITDIESHLEERKTGSINTPDEFWEAITGAIDRMGRDK